MGKKLILAFFVILLLVFTTALPQDAELNIDFTYPQVTTSTNVTGGNVTINTTQFASSDPISIKESWLTSFVESISKWANYWTKTENINQTGYNITADYFVGNGSQLTGISSGSSVSFGTDNQIPYTNAGGDDFDYSENLTFDGQNITFGSSEIGLNSIDFNDMDITTDDLNINLGTTSEININNTGGTNYMKITGDNSYGGYIAYDSRVGGEAVGLTAGTSASIFGFSSSGVFGIFTDTYANILSNGGATGTQRFQLDKDGVMKLIGATSTILLKGNQASSGDLLAGAVMWIDSGTRNLNIINSPSAGVAGATTMNVYYNSGWRSMVYMEQNSPYVQLAKGTGTHAWIPNDNGKLIQGASSDDYSQYWDGTNEVYNTSTGIAYFSNNVSATGFVTRTSVYDKDDGSALELVKDADELIKPTGEIDHKEFYGYTQFEVTDKSRPVISEVCNDVEQENDKGLMELKRECYNVTSYPYKKMEDGVDLGKEIDVLRQAVYELKIQNQFLQEQINNLTGKDTQLEEANIRQDEALCSIKLFSWCLIK